MAQESFVIPQKAMIMDGERYLILKRSPDEHTYPNCWDFPRGRLEQGEDASRGLEREVLEETGLKIRAIKPLFVFHETVRQWPLVYIVYLCRRISGKVKLSPEHTEYRWARRGEILELDIENYLRAFLQAKN